MEEIVRIPAERVRALMGPGSGTKELIEKKCNVKLSMSTEGEVVINGESADVFFSKDIIIAIGRGFEPSVALKLTKEDYHFHLIHLKEYLSSEKAITRIKGRIIGENGKMKEEMESATESDISIYGNTVAIISKMDSMEYAKEAIELLISGANHSTVYAYLARARRKIFDERLRA
ncbi:RNA-processing protein [Candidatus Micrarchaeota archaeon]|nr:RNA-processing protein [Candidatus Micrarchaeota archaeon]